MAKGYSLHVGVNTVDQNHYQGLTDLPSCENDAQFMYEVAQKFGYQESVIFPHTDKEGNEQRPTSQNVLSTLAQFSQELEAGDMLLFTYSGHGGQIPDPTGEEEDSLNETYCLYDRQLLDNEINVAFSKFKPGVRILVFLDSCHSGTATKSIDVDLDALLSGEIIKTEPKVLTKRIPEELYEQILTKNAQVYSDVREGLHAAGKNKAIKATLKSFAAVKDNQLALAGTHYSLFTNNLRDILKSVPKISDYKTLQELLESTANEGQQEPFFQSDGPSDETFDNSVPFMFPGGTVPEIIVEESEASELVELIVDFEEETVDPGTILAGLSKGFSIGGTPTKDTSGGFAPTNSIVLQTSKDTEQDHKAWDLAYQAFHQFHSQGKNVFIEPNVKSEHHTDTSATKSVTSDNPYMPTWPSPSLDNQDGRNEFVWHLDDEHSQLAAARDELLALPEEERRVRIAHIDTGYTPEHPSTPEKVLKHLAKSFVKGEEDNPGEEIWKNKKKEILEQDGHGLATLAILAGNKVTKDQSYGGYEGYLGAVPFAEIVPIRIADTVALIFESKSFSDALYYAIEQKCDVVTMSMAGNPSRKWTKAINAAYEAGVTVVTAAGNNWRKGFNKILPKVVLYPSRFDRVITATGMCVNHEPYDFEANSHELNSKTAGGENMQGNWGPTRTMRTAVAGYTPNLPWAVINKPHLFARAGGGTSSATPQVAATAALWIAKHRKTLEAKGYAGTWKQVEAVRKAIFETADKSYFAYQQYLGHGAIKAKDALAYPVPDITEDHKSPKARIFFAGITEFLRPFIQTITKSEDAGEPVPDRLFEMAGLEIIQLLYKDPSLLHYSKHLDLESDKLLFENAAQAEGFKKKLKESPYISAYLKGLL